MADLIDRLTAHNHVGQCHGCLHCGAAAEIERLRADAAELGDLFMARDNKLLAEIERLRGEVDDLRRCLEDDQFVLGRLRTLADQLAEALAADPQQDMGIRRRAAIAAHEEARRDW